ncbi:hypothetical protein P885DRAFT_46008 [Corynascus similis CBS 632.67]
MANLSADNTDVNPALNASFSHLTVSSPQDSVTQDIDPSASWITQGASFPLQTTTNSFGTAQQPLTDPALPPQVDAQQHQFDHGQYLPVNTGQAHWQPDDAFPPSGQSSSSPTANLGSQFACEWSGCTRTFPRQCDLESRRRCDICGAGGAETKDLYRHMWAHHSDEARARGLPREEDICLRCGYSGRRDNVKRHKDNLGHW